MKTLLQLVRSWLMRETVSYYTTDGHHLAPYPNMTDEDLDDFERFYNVPRRTFPKHEQSGRIT